jgi:2-C-methyl-D-erythritol 4-phosphate cytidylyltransferase/2-C-methyl-D-erythritol 2,4-cyclodiphosphate synthase
VPLSSVSIKATTTEKLGFVGRAEGLAAQAAATVRVPEICAEIETEAETNERRS